MLCLYLSRTIFVGVLGLAIFLTTISSQTPDIDSNAGNNLSDKISAVDNYTPEINVTSDTEIQELNSQLRDSPRDPIIHNNLAVVYFQSGRLKEAYSAVSRSIKLNDRLVVTQLNLSMISEYLGYRDISLAAAAKAVSLDPANRKARRYKCLLDLTFERDKKALDCYRNYAKKFSPASDVDTNLSEALYRNGELSEARKILEKVLKKYPHDLIALNILGKTYFSLKKYKTGVKILKNAVEISPDHPELRYNLAMCYLALKNRPAVFSQYKLLKSQNPKLARMLYNNIYKNRIVDASRYLQ